jgi:hypothetical protein
MLRSRRSFLFLSLTLGACLCSIIPNVFAAGGVEGKFKVKVEPDEDARKAGAKEYDDTLTITASKFISEAGKKHGFGETSYDEDSTRFGPATFTAEATSDKEGKAKWSGTVTVNEITGEMTWTKKDGSELHYTFKGSKS